MTVKQLIDFLQECPEDANINIKDYSDSTPYHIEELAGFFNGVKNVVNIYIYEDHAHWITKTRHEHYPSGKEYEEDFCSACGMRGSIEYDYCPHCGSKMDGGSE